MIEQSVVREGSHRAFMYTHKTTVEIKGQVILKKRAISAAEYVELESQRISDINQLKSTRLCTIDDGLYMIIDWYEFVDGQPLTCII